MAEIAIFSVAQLAPFSEIFSRPQSAEGSWGWYQSLIETTLSADEEPVFAVAYEGVKAHAVLPLARRGRRLRALTAPYTTCYVPAFPEVHWARYLGAGAHSFVRGSLHLDALDLADPGITAFLDGLQSSGLVAAQYENFQNFYEPVGDFEEYWHARPSRLKSTVRRKLTQAVAHQAEFRCYRNPTGEAVSVYEKVYAASWKEAEPHPRFIATMVEKLGQYGFVRIGVMMLRHAPVAAQIWLVCGRRATIFKLAHCEDAKERSPGTLLTHWMMSTLIRQEGLKEIDLGRGADAYKRDWLTKSRMRSGIVAANWHSLAGLRAITGEVMPTRFSAFARKGRGRPAV